jgi:hypothetical protein
MEMLMRMIIKNKNISLLLMGGLAIFLVLAPFAAHAEIALYEQMRYRCALHVRGYVPQDLPEAEQQAFYQRGMQECMAYVQRNAEASQPQPVAAAPKPAPKAMASELVMEMHDLQGNQMLLMDNF